VRVLVFHGYLLRGTGSNVYNAELAAALARLGHEVHLVCQDRDPLELDFVDAAGDWDAGELRVSARRRPARVTTYRPDIGGLLPVYVADRYAGFDARPFPDLDDDQLDRYLEANVAAVSEVVERAEPEVALANHLIMGPAILARALAGRVPYAIKVHGSALEYTVKPHPRFLPFAREGVAPAAGVLVGSRHTAESLWAALDDPDLPARTRLGPPGVDIHAFRPRSPDDARAGLATLIERLQGNARGVQVGADSASGPSSSSFDIDPARAAQALRTVDAETDRLVVFVGKLLLAKGIDLLLTAWPLLIDAVPNARLLVIGFGGFQAGAERMVGALAGGDLGPLRRLAERGRAEEDGPEGRLDMLTAFLERLDGDAAARERYLAAAPEAAARIAFTGRLEHAELADLLPACEALVVPSTFPEAFGMVAVEAAACAALPVSARHSGLAEVSDELAAALPPPARPWLAFDLGPRAVEDLAACLGGWLQAPADVRAPTREALVETVRARWSWEGVGEGVIAAAQGRLDALPSVRVPAP
jgi:glycosyltransferase involved in cell wall biosynthesis